MSVVRHAVFTSNQGLLRSQNTQTRDPLCRFSVPLLLRPPNQRHGWEGFVMIYSPISETELEVVLDLLRSSYGYVTGRSIPK